MKKKMEQQLEEELEKKDNVKKQLERKARLSMSRLECAFVSVELFPHPTLPNSQEKNTLLNSCLSLRRTTAVALLTRSYFNARSLPKPTPKFRFFGKFGGGCS